MELRIGETNKGKRLDVVVSAHLTQSGPSWTRSLITRSIVERLVSSGVLLNGKSAKKSTKLRENDVVAIDLDTLKKILNRSREDKRLDFVSAQKGELDIVEESENWIVLNKPKGIVIHPGANNPSGTLANYVVGYLTSKGEYDETVKRGGVVHRLDKGVSGLVIFAKNRSSQLHLKKQFENREVVKIYLAKVRKTQDTGFSSSVENMSVSVNLQEAVAKYLQKGRDESWYEIEGNIARDTVNRMRMKFSTNSRSGRYSSLYIKPLSKSEFLIVLKTGRMHQIRATLRYLGYSILGDRLYGDLQSETSDRIELESIFLSLKDLAGQSRAWKLI